MQLIVPKLVTARHQLDASKERVQNNASQPDLYFCPDRTCLLFYMRVNSRCALSSCSVIDDIEA